MKLVNGGSVSNNHDSLLRLKDLNNRLERLNKVLWSWKKIESGDFFYEGVLYDMDNLIVDCLAVYLTSTKYQCKISLEGITELLIQNKTRLKRLAVKGRLCDVFEET